MRFIVLCFALFGAFILPAYAEDENGWSGEGAFSAGVSTGNTETSDLGFSLNVTKARDEWTHNVKASVDYGETDSVQSRNRFYASGRSDYKISDKTFLFGQASFEHDKFSGFENRYFVGLGAGRHLLDGEKAKWTVRAAPGLKVDEVREVSSGGVVVTPAETVESFSVLGNSDFSYKFNENVSLSNASSVIYAKESSQFTNTFAVTASLTDTLSARVSLDVRHDTDPPAGFEKTDTSTRVSLVYKFGG